MARKRWTFERIVSVGPRLHVSIVKFNFTILLMW